MQFHINDFNPLIHDKFKCLTVKQPYAQYIVNGEKKIEVRSRPTKYRGDVLICSSKNPVIYGIESGCTLGFVEIYDIKKVSDFTPEDWDNTKIPESKRGLINGGYGWLMRNPRKVIEFPVKGQLGIYNIAYSKDMIIEYPKNK